MMEIVALTSDPKVFVVRDTSGAPERLCRDRDIPRKALERARTIVRERWRTDLTWNVEISENPAFNSALYPEQDCIFVSWMYEEKPCETAKAIKLAIKQGIEAIPQTKAEKRAAKYASHDEFSRYELARELERIQEAADNRWAAEMTALGYKRCHEYDCGDWSLWTVPDAQYGEAIANSFPLCPTCAVKVENKEAA